MSQRDPEELLQILLSKGSHYISDTLNNYSKLINVVNTVLAIKNDRIAELEKQLETQSEKTWEEYDKN